MTSNYKKQNTYSNVNPNTTTQDIFLKRFADPFNMHVRIRSQSVDIPSKQKETRKLNGLVGIEN